MRQIWRQYSCSFLLAMLIHLTVFSLLIFSVHRSEQSPIVNKGENIIHATAFENTQIETIKKQQQIARQQIERAKQAQAKKAAQAKKEAEEKKEQIKQQKRAAEKKKIQAQKLAVEKAVALKKKQIERQEKAVKQAEESKKKERQRFEAAAALQKQIAAKQAVITQQRSQAIHGIVDQYKGLILEAISKQWLVPLGVEPTLSCRLMISLGSHGQVQNVLLLKSSGNALLDQSAIAAVYKASPLPLPSDAEAAALFKQFSLTLKPEQVLDR